jgi:hypothetical protein
MTALGWIFMTASLLFVWGLTAWCFWRVLTEHEKPKVSPPPAGT